jgi:hypothetical protein
VSEIEAVDDEQMDDFVASRLGPAEWELRQCVSMAAMSLRDDVPADKAAR